MSCPLRYFDQSNRLTQDPCALAQRDFENESLHNYQTYNFTPRPTDPKRNVFNEFVACNPNLRLRDGYGFAPEFIDTDSSARFSAPDKTVRGPERRQLFTRVFHAVPDFGRGTCAPNTESMLKTGAQDTSIYKDCAALAERNFDRYIPFVDDMQTYIKEYGNSLANVNTIGVSSRDEMRRQDLKHACYPQREQL